MVMEAIFNELMKTHNETAWLEMCEWDSEKAVALAELASDVTSDIVDYLEDDMSPLESHGFEDLFRVNMKEHASVEQIDFLWKSLRSDIVKGNVYTDDDLPDADLDDEYDDDEDSDDGDWEEEDDDFDDDEEWDDDDNDGLDD